MKLGVLVNNLGPSQLNYFLIRNGNAALKDARVADLIAFYQNLAKPCIKMHFPAMQAAEAWGFDGTLVATDLATAAKLLRFPSAARKLFYVWDLEWIRQVRPFRALHAIYCHPDISLVARSEEHRRVLQECWKPPVAISEDFDFHTLCAA